MFGHEICNSKEGRSVHMPGRTIVSVAAFFNQLFSFLTLLVVVLGPVSVKELVSVEDASSARFVRYGI